MKATIKQASCNERNLTVRLTGYGHWKIECDYRNKRISCTTTDAPAVDDFNSEHWEIKDKCNRRKQGYESLINEIISKL